MQVEVSAAEKSAVPGYDVLGNAIGGVTPGDLFYIDSTGTSADIMVTLHMTNAAELIHSYRYMIFDIGVYVQTDADHWERATLVGGDVLPDTYITMRNGRVSLNLPGYAEYKITIDGGSYYSYSTADTSGVSPNFYLAVE